MSGNNNLYLAVTLALLVCFITGNKQLYSQDSLHASPVFVQAAFLYNFPQSYGLASAINYPYLAITKSKTRENGQALVKHKDRYFGIEASVYRYPFNYTGLLVTPTLGTRHYVDRIFFYETSIGIGLMRTFYDGRVYKVDAAGNILEKPLFGRFYATTNLSAAFNLSLQKAGHKIVALQLKPALWFQFPFESFIKPQVSLTAGVNYQINTRNTMTRNKTKHINR